jgi:multiple sugar transport system substrate-binding protein
MGGRALPRRAFLRLSLGAGGVVLAAVAAACRPPAGSTPAAPVESTAARAARPPDGRSPRTIAFSVWGDPAEKAAYEQLTASFNRREAGVTARLVHTPGQNDYLQRLAADFAAGAPADLILLNYRRFAAYAARGALEIIDPYVTSSTLLQRAAFYPEAMAAFSRGGKLVGLPQNVSSLVIYINKGLFDRAGVPHPKDGWTWDDLLPVAKALTTGTGQYGIGIEPTTVRLAPFVWQNGGELVDDPAAPARLTLDRPESTEALQWFVDLQVRHKVAPDAAQQSAEDDESRFLNGRTAMFLDSRRAVPTLRTIKDFDWDVSPLPGRRQRASILHSDAYFLTAASRDKPGAWAFMEYANSPQGQTVVARTGRTVPSLRGVAESPAFLTAEAKPASNRVFLDAIPFVRRTINVEATEQIEQIVNNEIKRSFYGQASVAEAVETATARTAALFRR